MTTHTIYGIRTTGDVADGTLTYAGTAKFRLLVPESFNFSFSYLTGGVFNSFGIPEFEDNSDYGSVGYGELIGVPEVDESYIYELNFTGGGMMQVVELYDVETDSSYLFAIGGDVTTLPTSQSQLDALAGDIDTSNPASQILSGISGSPTDWANTSSSENDRIFDTLGASVSIDGGLGNDAIYVLDGDDNVFAGDGNDRVVAAGDGNNVISGQAGNDVLKFKTTATGLIAGGDGDDRIFGGDLADILRGEAGSDTIIGLSGKDIIEGGADDDFLYGGRDNDIVRGGDGDDVVRGNRNDDVLTGGGGSDKLYGGGNNDTLEGDAGRDFLLGENGGDVLDGGTGNDNLTGGDGLDMFVFSTGYGFDRILDFENGVDVINLFGTDASGLDDITVSAAGGGTATRLDFGSGDTLYLDGVTTGEIDSSDFIFGIG